MNLIGQQIKRRREELGYSQTDLARIIGKSPAAISQFESGHRFPSTQVLTKLADALRVTTEYLLGKKEWLDINDMLKNDIEDILENESVRALFRDFKNLSQRDKNTISAVIKSLKQEKENKE